MCERSSTNVVAFLLNIVLFQRRTTVESVVDRVSF